MDCLSYEFHCNCHTNVTDRICHCDMVYCTGDYSGKRKSTGGSSSGNKYTGTYRKVNHPVKEERDSPGPDIFCAQHDTGHIPYTCPGH